MANFQFNVAKGQIKTLFNNVATSTPSSSAIIVVPLAADSEDDETLKDHDTLAALLAEDNTEQTDLGRKELQGADVTVTVNDSTNKLILDMADSITWAAATGDPIDKLIFCYAADKDNDSDTAIVPLLAYDFEANPSGIDIIVSAHANGLIEIE